MLRKQLAGLLGEVGHLLEGVNPLRPKPLIYLVSTKSLFPMREEKGL